MEFEPIIGLEIHVELKTKSKMFCGCSADYFGKEPNTHCCPVCLGLPGALPVPNKKAVEWCVMLGMALNCQIPEFSKFDRKNYFYPDLPKGYQISQYDKPLAINGSLLIKTSSSSPPSQGGERGGEKAIRIRRVHMEEDTGKLLHATVGEKNVTLIDFNRSGVPLVEIVTEPDIRSSEEAKVFLKKLHQIIRYLDISDANMEEGSMRLEPNVSVREIPNPKSQIPNKSKIQNSKLPNYKVEVKNINSFNFAKKAIEYEIERHGEKLKNGETPRQETRGWDEKKGITVSQRSKEEAHDYRYFPEPDIPPIHWNDKWLDEIRAEIPELPEQKMDRFIMNYRLSEYDTTILTDSLESANYYEQAIKVAAKNIDITAKRIANWIINKRADITKISPQNLVQLIEEKTVPVGMDEKQVEEIIKRILETNARAVADYKSGKQSVIMFLVGQVMRETKGKADASQIKKLLVANLQ